MAMTPKEQLDIIAAHIAGEEIQFQFKNKHVWDERFVCPPNCLFNFCDFNYRKKPKPLEVWVNVYHDGLLAAYASKEGAATFISEGGRTVHMREVADEDSGSL